MVSQSEKLSSAEAVLIKKRLRKDRLIALLQFKGLRFTRRDVAEHMGALFVNDSDVDNFLSAEAARGTIAEETYRSSRLGLYRLFMPAIQEIINENESESDQAESEKKSGYIDSFEEKDLERAFNELLLIMQTRDQPMTSVWIRQNSSWFEQYTLEAITSFMHQLKDQGDVFLDRIYWYLTKQGQKKWLQYQREKEERQKKQYRKPQRREDQLGVPKWQESTGNQDLVLSAVAEISLREDAYITSGIPVKVLKAENGIYDLLPEDNKPPSPWVISYSYRGLEKRGLLELKKQTPRQWAVTVQGWRFLRDQKLLSRQDINIALGLLRIQKVRQEASADDVSTEVNFSDEQMQIRILQAIADLAMNYDEYTVRGIPEDALYSLPAHVDLNLHQLSKFVDELIRKKWIKMNIVWNETYWKITMIGWKILGKDEDPTCRELAWLNLEENQIKVLLAIAREAESVAFNSFIEEGVPINYLYYPLEKISSAEDGIPKEFERIKKMLDKLIEVGWLEKIWALESERWRITDTGWEVINSFRKERKRNKIEECARKISRLIIFLRLSPAQIERVLNIAMQNHKL